ncbi:MAG: GNAT family N-acetyltransferase, partial [Gammaproteobacteria bacterium]|nr:GNAT family N-acetyltransferase [Gammaproteobacteria bacterium]
ERYEAAARPGLQLALSNEPVADMNMVIVGAGVDHDHFRNMVSSCLDRRIPFLVMIYPDAGKALDDIAADLGLVYAADFPIMVRDDLPLEPSGNPDVDVVRAQSVEDADASADVMVSAYSMPKDSVLRALPASLFASPGADVYVARLNGEPAGSVTLTYHGDTCGIWAMGTDAARQRGGIGLMRHDSVAALVCGYCRLQWCKRAIAGSDAFSWVQHRRVSACMRGLALRQFAQPESGCRVKLIRRSCARDDTYPWPSLNGCIWPLADSQIQKYRGV